MSTVGVHLYNFFSSYVCICICIIFFFIFAFVYLCICICVTSLSSYSCLWAESVCVCICEQGVCVCVTGQATDWRLTDLAGASIPDCLKQPFTLYPCQHFFPFLLVLCKCKWKHNTNTQIQIQGQYTLPGHRYLTQTTLYLANMSYLFFSFCANTTGNTTQILKCKYKYKDIDNTQHFI